MPQWKVRTFYDLAKAMVALHSRRLLFDRLGLGDGTCSCSVCKLFDDNIQNEAYTEADCWFTEEEETAVVPARANMRPDPTNDGKSNGALRTLLACRSPTDFEQRQRVQRVQTQADAAYDGLRDS